MPEAGGVACSVVKSGFGMDADFGTILFAFGLTLFACMQTLVTNLVWSSLTLGDHRFESYLEELKMVWIYLSNAMAIILSVGLLVPWATIRTVRYRLANLYLYPSGELDNFIAGEDETIDAVGEEIIEFFDFDIGL